MSEPIELPALAVDLQWPPQTKWEREYRAFLQMLPELLKTHRGKYVAVHEGQVVESGGDELALVSLVWTRVGYVPIHVGLVTGQQRPPERVPSCRTISLE